jgi:hypothetical protein
MWARRLFPADFSCFCLGSLFHHGKTSFLGVPRAWVAYGFTGGALLPYSEIILDGSVSVIVACEEWLL